MTWLNRTNVLLSETLWVGNVLFADLPEVRVDTGLGMNNDANDQVTKLALPSANSGALELRRGSITGGCLASFGRRTFWRREL